MAPEIIERRASDYTQAKLYVISGVTLTVVAILAITVLVATEKPGQDRSATVAIIIAMLPSTLAALYAAIKSSEATTKQDITMRKVSSMEENVNGKMTQLMEAKGQAAHAEGRSQGVMEGVAAATGAATETAVAAAVANGTPVVVIPAVPAQVLPVAPKKE